jgi:hypothetical protein
MFRNSHFSFTASKPYQLKIRLRFTSMKPLKRHGHGLAETVAAPAPAPAPRRGQQAMEDVRRRAAQLGLTGPLGVGYGCGNTIQMT